MILNEKVFPAFSEKWGIEFYNPCESIDDIREKINKGEYAKEQHPYYNWYGKKDLPVIEHEISNERPIDLLNGIDNYYHFKDFHNVKYGNSETYLFISRNTFKDRVVISFNPDSNLEDIVGKLKKIRNLELKKRKLTLKNENQKMYNIKDINKYINWLKIYDEIKSNIIQLCDGKNLNPVYKSGYLCVPKQISFTEIIPSNFTAERFESATKQYNRAYYGACDLIKNSPYLKFVFPKVPKKKN